LVFYDVGEDLIMADDVVMPSNPLIASIEVKEPEEARIDMNVFPTVMRRRTIQKSGVHSSQLFSMGSSIIS